MRQREQEAMRKLPGLCKLPKGLARPGPTGGGNLVGPQQGKT